MRTISIDTIKQSGQETTVQGWVASRRDHGGLIFIDLRDHKGIVQLTITPDSPEMFKIAEGLRDEYVIEATGMVKDRAEDLKNPNIATGGVEIVVSNIRILNKSDALPFQVNTTQNVSEEHRLRYRYLDLRGDKMQARLKQRSEFNKYIRRYMEDLEFTEVATPVLANSSPEGARDFVIPSRHHPGQFYALPQAPQQFKQLLMVGGVDRYYQFATCFRDEDPRADRLYGDFYQLDLEMAFTEQGSVVLDTMEPLIKNLVTDFGGKQLLSDDVPRMTFEHAMETYGTDKPDLRFGMELIDLTEELTGCGFGVFSGAIEKGGAVKAILVKDGAKFSRSYIDKLTDIAKSAGAGGLPYIKFTDAYKNENNGEVSLVQSSEDAKVFGGPISKFFTSDELLSVFKKVDFNPYTDIILFGSDSRAKVNKVLGSLRSHLGDVLELKDPNVVALCWVIDFPFYEVDESTGKLDFGHNPFSMPKVDVAELSTMSQEEKQALVADQYDMVMNGYEICSGAVRNHNPDVMYEVFGALGYDKQYVEDKFGGMLNAFKFGAPPHAGCAFGLDRIFMVLVGESNIREVVAFPKNGSGVDLMMQSPGTLDQNQLDELSIQINLED